jgi:hypothetical protein
VIVAAEMLTGGVGIGFWVWDEWNNLNVKHIIIAIFVIGIVGLVRVGWCWLARALHQPRLVTYDTGRSRRHASARDLMQHLSQVHRDPRGGADLQDRQGLFPRCATST